MTTQAKKLSQPKQKTSFLKKLANRLVRLSYGKEMYISEYRPSPIAGVCAFYYVENGMRHYIFVKKSKEMALQFVSCLGFNGHQNIVEALSQTLETFFGKPFMRSFDKNLISMETISTVPVFSYKEDASHENAYNVHTFAWHIQITQEQAQLCQPNENEDIDILAVPEVGVTNQPLSESHRAILSTLKDAERKSRKNDIGENIGADLLEDILQGTTTPSRTIH